MHRIAAEQQHMQHMARAKRADVTVASPSEWNGTEWNGARAKREAFVELSRVWSGVEWSARSKLIMRWNKLS